jgi:hypothetical protein
MLPGAEMMGDRSGGEEMRNCGPWELEEFQEVIIL